MGTKYPSLRFAPSKLLCLCTCTYLELMTAVGVTAYLIYLDKMLLALIAAIVFGKVIVFHFIIDYYDKRKNKTKLNLQIR